MGLGEIGERHYGGFVSVESSVWGDDPGEAGGVFGYKVFLNVPHNHLEFRIPRAHWLTRRVQFSVNLSHIRALPQILFP